MEPTWILVADSARARLFSVERPRGPLNEHSDYVNPADRLRDQDLETDAPGRGARSGGGGRYSMGGDTGTKDHYAKRFARDLADVLHKGRAAHKFRRLYVMAAPNFLGALREFMDPPTAACVVGSYAKDVVRERPDGIRKHLPYRL